MKEKNILTVDIGNSSIKVGLFTGETLHKELLSTNSDQDFLIYSRRIKDLIGEHNIDGSILSSVVQEYTDLFLPILSSLTEGSPLILSTDLDMGITFDVDSPERVGTDRVAGAVAAYHRFQRPVVTVDCGTATTINVVDRGERFIGGAIMPGIITMSRCLSEKTSALPSVTFNRPVTPLGKDTEGCIISGIVLGTAGAIERIIEEIEGDLGYRLKIVLTGGSSDMITHLLRRVDYLDPDLSLRGLKIIYEKTQG